MKFLCKKDNYEAKNNSGVFPEAFIQDIEKRVSSDDNLIISFVLFYIYNGEVKKSNYESFLNFTTDHKDMYIKPEKEGDNPIELTEFLSKGGVYSKEKVYSWGHPSAKAVKQYFDPNTIWNKLEFADTPFKQIAIDWVEHNLRIDERLIVDNFSYVEQ